MRPYRIALRQAQLCPNWTSIAKKSVPAIEPFAAVRFHAFGPLDGPRSKAVWYAGAAGGAEPFADVC